MERAKYGVPGILAAGYVLNALQILVKCSNDVDWVSLALLYQHVGGEKFCSPKEFDRLIAELELEDLVEVSYVNDPTSQVDGARPQWIKPVVGEPSISLCPGQ